jgi:hypothetical protein
MKKLALLLSLLALGVLGLTACGGDDDDEATAASATEAARERTSCGRVRVTGPYPLMKVAVIEGDVACRVARGVVEDFWTQGASGLVRGSWRCDGPDSFTECWKGQFTPSAEKIRARAPIDEGGQTPDPTEASETATGDGNPYDYDELAADPADNKSCGAYERWRLAVVRGISCGEALRVMYGVAYGGNRVPDGWICYGGDQPVECRSEAGGTIRAPVRNAVLRRWEARYGY